MRGSRLVSSVIAATAAMATWGCGGGYTNPSSTSGGGAATTISIVGHNGAQSFSPNPVSIREGDMVIWHNGDNLMHHIVLNDNSLDTGDIAPGASTSARRLSSNGANYHCTIHPTEIGGINAASGAPPPCQGQYC